jgi:hypothetical protein
VAFCFSREHHPKPLEFHWVAPTSHQVPDVVFIGLNQAIHTPKKPSAPRDNFDDGGNDMYVGTYMWCQLLFV